MATPLAPGFYWTGDGEKWTPEQVAALAQKHGLPGWTFSEIADGESGFQPFVQQKDPGDRMVGYGFWQLTPNAWGADSAAMRKFRELGGIQGMLNVDNQAKMAKFLFDAAGGKITPWYGTSKVTNPNRKYDGNGSYPSPNAAAPSDGSTPAPDDSSGGILGPITGNITKALVWIALVLGGAALLVAGTGRIAMAGSTPGGA